MARSCRTVLKASPNAKQNKKEIDKITKIMGSANAKLTPVKDKLQSPKERRKEHEVRKT